MDLPKSPYETTISESWLWTIREFERLPSRPQGEHLLPLIALTRQIAATNYSRSYRAGTHLLSSLMITTATRHGQETDEPCIIVRPNRHSVGFSIEYHKDGDTTELEKSYNTDDKDVIWANLRRDMIDHFECGETEAWETLQPLLVRLWNETHKPIMNRRDFSLSERQLTPKEHFNGISEKIHSADHGKR